MIFQTTIQRFFKSNGVDYAMAMDVENDIVISETRSAAFGIHNEWVRREKGQGVEYESCISNPDNYNPRSPIASNNPGPATAPLKPM